MTLILEIPSQTENRLRLIADARGETLEAFTLTQLEKLATENGTNGAAKPETREQRRARISAAIDEAQRHFGPLLHGGDAVSQIVAEGRAGVERAAERGL